ncbi:uncharacterized protein [Argopecten irradians]|uniref:uncharacterized protein n=2 Tax=Argopecten irradians TaxID=31199 RepID=UPI0037236150
MELFVALFLALEVILQCLGKFVYCGKVVFYTSFRSLVDRVATSLAVVVSRGLSLAEAVVVYATCCCRGEVFPVPAADQPSSSSVVPAVPVPASPVPIRRSGRATRRPAWHNGIMLCDVIYNVL